MFLYDFMSANGIAYNPGTTPRSAGKLLTSLGLGGEASVYVSDELRARLRYFIDVLFFFERYVCLAFHVCLLIRWL